MSPICILSPICNSLVLIQLFFYSLWESSLNWKYFFDSLMAWIHYMGYVHRVFFRDQKICVTCECNERVGCWLPLGWVSENWPYSHENILLIKDINCQFIIIRTLIIDNKLNISFQRLAAKKKTMCVVFIRVS